MTTSAPEPTTASAPEGSVGPFSTLAGAARAFRYTAIAEAISWLVLIVATVVKYAAGNAIGVHVMGPLHGILVVLYLGFGALLIRPLRWSAGTIVMVLVEMLIPGGGFLAARRADVVAAAT